MEEEKKSKTLENKKEINDWLIKDTIISDIRTLVEQKDDDDDDDDFKLKRVGNSWNNNYIRNKN